MKWRLACSCGKHGVWRQIYVASLINDAHKQIMLFHTCRSLLPLTRYKCSCTSSTIKRRTVGCEQEIKPRQRKRMAPACIEVSRKCTTQAPQTREFLLEPTHSHRWGQNYTFRICNCTSPSVIYATISYRISLRMCGRCPPSGLQKVVKTELLRFRGVCVCICLGVYSGPNFCSLLNNLRAETKGHADDGSLSTRAFTISDFHYTIIVAKRIPKNDIITKKIWEEKCHQ